MNFFSSETFKLFFSNLITALSTFGTGLKQVFFTMNNLEMYNELGVSKLVYEYGEKIIKELKNLKEIIVVGCCTDICDFNGTMGLANYLDQWNRDVEIKVYQEYYEKIGYRVIVFNVVV